MTSRRSIAGWVLAVGAILMLAATVFTWGTVSGPAATVDVNGFNSDGYITDGFAVVFLILAFALMKGPRRWLSIVSTVLTLAGLGWMLIVLSAVNSFSSLYPDSTAQGITVTSGPGILIALVGAAAALIGAIASFFAPRGTTATTAAPRAASVSPAP
jgi:hypothetical protein